MGGKKSKRIPPAVARVDVGPKSLDRLAHHQGDGLESHARPVWSFALLDDDYHGSWSWRQADFKQVFAFLKEMERLSWREIEQQMYRPPKKSARPKHHAQSVETLCNEAKKRLTELALDVDDLFRFRLDGKGRLWGVRLPRSKVFCLLWWDPDHQVYLIEN